MMRLPIPNSHSRRNPISLVITAFIKSCHKLRLSAFSFSTWFVLKMHLGYVRVNVKPFKAMSATAQMLSAQRWRAS